jgi:hypothetical protein
MLIYKNMTVPGVITPETNESLRKAAAAYAGSIDVPCFLDEVDGFARAYLGEDEEEGLKTLVTGDEEGLAVSVDDKEGKTKIFVNVDLAMPDGIPASIVAPGFYDKKGRPDNENGQYGRPVVRALTEVEGQELAMDLHSLMVKIPQDRRLN